MSKDPTPRELATMLTGGKPDPCKRCGGNPNVGIYSRNTDGELYSDDKGLIHDVYCGTCIWPPRVMRQPSKMLAVANWNRRNAKRTV